MAEESIKKFLIGKSVTRHDYNGGGFDRHNCQKVLSCLDELITIAPLLMIPCIETLRKFKIVTEGCFGMKLSLEFSRDIQEFVSEMCNLHKYLIEYTTHKICLGWKFHIIQSHLVMFLERKNKPLGIFYEQSCEAVHKNINKIIKRFAASELSKCH
nr:uncharacterized protein LOC124813537 [Hydra vulgaris]